MCCWPFLSIHFFLFLSLISLSSHTYKEGLVWLGGDREKRQIERIDRKNVFLSPSLPHLCLCVFALSYYYSCSAPSLYRPSALASVPQAFYLSVSFSHSSRSLTSSRGVPVFCLVLPFLPLFVRSFVVHSFPNPPLPASIFHPKREREDAKSTSFPRRFFLRLKTIRFSL